MHTYRLRVHFDRGYIADPYWPARDRLINIQKSSGLNRARSASGRRKALEEHLQSIGQSLEWYEALEQQANEPFYRVNGVGSPIIIPDLHVFAFLVQTCDQIRSATRPSDPEQVRSRFLVTPWTTGKTTEDGLFERFATVASGTGQKLSNQRGLRVSKYIRDFTAEGLVSFEPDFVDAKTLKAAIDWGGNFVGIGASRKMGYGRFKVQSFELESP